MITANHSPETDKALIEELAKILWHLDRRGYIQGLDDEDEGDVLNLRMMAKNAVKRARARLALPEIKE